MDDLEGGPFKLAPVGEVIWSRLGSHWGLVSSHGGQVGSFQRLAGCQRWGGGGLPGFHSPFCLNVHLTAPGFWANTVEWLCPSPDSLAWNTISQHDGAGRGGLWSVTGSQGQSLPEWDECPHKRDPFPDERTQWGSACLWIWKWTLIGHWVCQHLGRPWETNDYFLRPPVNGILLEWPKWTKRVGNRQVFKGLDQNGQ